MENYFDKEFELRYFETSKSGLATPATMLTLLEETAADHCYEINRSLFDLANQNIGWVLAGGKMQINRYPAYKEKIVVRTWLSKYSTVKGIRENLIYDANKNIIGRAKGLWVFFDIQRRRPVQIFDDIIKKWSGSNEESIIYDTSKKIDSVEIADYSHEFVVNLYDTDMYKHANNIKYLSWLIESLPEEIIDNYYLHSIKGNFISEAKFGDTIQSLTKLINDNTFLHTIKIKNSNKVCATAKTV